jgi:hypothetical protein
MARKCDSPGCGFYLPDKYPLAKCPWHMAPGRGPVKIAAALTIAAAGFGGGFAYKRFRRYLNERKLRKEREESRQRQASAAEAQQKPASVPRKRSVKSQKRQRTRKTSATKSKRKTAGSGSS